MWLPGFRRASASAAVVALLALAGGTVSAGAVVATDASAHPQNLSKCTFAALRAAVAKGGVIDLRCGGTIAFTAPVVITHGSVTLDASGESVIFDGGAATQLFQVKHGSLTPST